MTVSGAKRPNTDYVVCIWATTTGEVKIDEMPVDVLEVMPETIKQV
jgi:hypothetical protein